MATMAISWKFDVELYNRRINDSMKVDVIIDKSVKQYLKSLINFSITHKQKMGLSDIMGMVIW